METVKLDIQKLQLLNDRIAQTLDALNQVRLSVHGLQQMSGVQHSSANPWQTPGVGFSPYGQSPYGQSPYGQFGQQPFVPQQFGPQQFGPQQFGPQQFGPQQFGPQTGMPGIPGMMQPGMMQPGIQHSSPLAQQSVNPFGFAVPNTQQGLSHSSYGIDPTWQIRVSQTFPFAQYQYVPNVY